MHKNLSKGLTRRTKLGNIYLKNGQRKVKVNTKKLSLTLLRKSKRGCFNILT